MDANVGPRQWDDKSFGERGSVSLTWLKTRLAQAPTLARKHRLRRLLFPSEFDYLALLVGGGHRFVVNLFDLLLNSERCPGQKNGP